MIIKVEVLFGYIFDDIWAVCYHVKKTTGNSLYIVCKGKDERPFFIRLTLSVWKMLLIHARLMNRRCVVHVGSSKLMHSQAPRNWNYISLLGRKEHPHAELNIFMTIPSR